MLIESKSKAGENEIPSADNSSVIEMGLKAFIVDLRKEFKGLDEVYFWHALCGGLGGIRPGTAHLHVKHIPIKTYPVVKCMMQGLAVDKVVEAGIGLVNLHQVVDFYNSMHSYMAGAGATGVKVNVIHIYLADYNHDKAEQSVLWTLSADVGNGYQCLRPVNNINLNMDAKAADGHVGGIRDGNELILFEWKKQSNQKWKLQPVH